MNDWFSSLASRAIEISSTPTNFLSPKIAPRFAPARRSLLPLTDTEHDLQISDLSDETSSPYPEWTTVNDASLQPLLPLFKLDETFDPSDQLAQPSHQRPTALTDRTVPRQKTIGENGTPLATSGQPARSAISKYDTQPTVPKTFSASQESAYWTPSTASDSEPEPENAQTRDSQLGNDRQYFTDVMPKDSSQSYLEVHVSGLSVDGYPLDSSSTMVTPIEPIERSAGQQDITPIPKQNEPLNNLLAPQRVFSENRVITPHVRQQTAQGSSRQSTSDESQNSPTVHISIGRIDIRAQTPAVQPVRSTQNHQPMGLSDYLRQRRGGREG